MTLLLTVLGKLIFLVLVPCLLLGFSVAMAQSETNTTLNETQHKDISVLCQSILADPKNVTLQALSPLGDQLYLIASDILYTVPFTSEIIDSVRGRFILRDTQSGTHWTQVPWLKQFAGAVKVPMPVLVQMTIWPEQVDNADLSGIYKQQINLLYRDQDSSSLSQSWKHPPSKREELPIKPYGLIHNGSETFGPVYEFRKIDSKTGIVMIADRNVLVLPCWAPNNKTLVFPANLPESDSGLRPLVTHLPVFGFIHSKVVHLWDLKNCQVILFDYVPVMATGNNESYKLQNKSASVRVIPFDEYLVCQGRMNISSDTLIILLGLLFLGLPLVLACIGLCCAMMCCSAPKVWSKSRKPAYPPLKVRSYNPKSFKSQSSTSGSTSSSTNSTTTTCSTITTKGTRTSAK